MARSRYTAEVRLVLVTAAVVAVLGIAAAALLLNPEAAVDSEVVLKAVDALEVKRVIIDNAYGTMDIAFQGEGYLVDDVPADVVDIKVLIDLLRACGTVTALSTVTGSAQDVAPYGLANPAARAAITYADGSTLTVLVGDVERISGNRYFTVAGDAAVYLMEDTLAANFLLPKAAFVDHQVTPELALSSPLSALLDVTFTGGRLAAPVTIEAVATKKPDVVLAALSFGAPTHIVRGRGVYELDQTYAVEMLGALLGIRAADVVGYRFTEQEIADFGFDNPTMRVEFDLKNGLNATVEHYILWLLKKNEAFYITSNRRPGVIYAIEEPPFLNIAYSKLPVRWFLSPLLIDVRAVEIVSQGETYAFVITGEKNADKRVALNGQAFDIDRFRTFYRLLIDAQHDGRLLENVEVAGTPLLQVTYHYIDERKPPDVMKLYPGDARRVYVDVNGVTELAMREMYVTRVREALDVLWTDEPIEIEW